MRDTEIRGFLCKITPKGKRLYMLYYRTKDGQERRPKIGVHGEITCDQARKIAQEWKAEIADGSDWMGAKKDRLIQRRNRSLNWRLSSSNKNAKKT